MARVWHSKYNSDTNFNFNPFFEYRIDDVATYIEKLSHFFHEFSLYTVKGLELSVGKGVYCQ